MLIPISEARFDINEMAERVFIGPQGVLMEKVEQFNRRWGRGLTEDLIRITKKFAFKPGTYDKIKQAHSFHILKYRMKPSGMYSLKRRIDESAWMARDFWNQAIDIDTIMANNRNNNIRWQENTSYVENYLNSLIERLNEEQETLRNNFPNDTVSILIDQDDLNDRHSWNHLKLTVEVVTKDITMNVIRQDENICSYDWGSVKTRWTIPLWSFLNNWCEGGPQSSNVQNTSYTPKALLFPKYVSLAHPYVSTRNTYSSPDGWIDSTCTGDHSATLRGFVWTLELLPLAILTRTWLSKYNIPATNPLTRIWYCYYGQPQGASDKLWLSRDHFTPKQVMGGCSFPDEYIRKSFNDDTLDNACDNCQFRDGYKWTNSSNVDVNYEPCAKAIRKYEGPATDEEAIKEAAILHFVVCNYMECNQEQYNLFTDDVINILRTSDNLFPKDATLCNILRNNPHYNIENVMLKASGRHLLQNHIDLLDDLFELNLFNNAMDELSQLLEMDIDEVRDEWYQSSLLDIEEEIRRINNRENIPTDNSHTIIEENLTPEERVIRWASTRGSTINL